MASKQARIQVEGFADSDVHLSVAVLQLKTGQVHLRVQGVEPTLEHLVEVRQLLDTLVRELDGRFPLMVQASVKEMIHG